MSTQHTRGGRLEGASSADLAEQALSRTTRAGCSQQARHDRA